MVAIRFSCVLPGTDRRVGGVVRKFYRKQRSLQWIRGALDDDHASQWMACNVFRIVIEYPKEFDAFAGGPRVLLPRTFEPIVFDRPIAPDFAATELFCGQANYSKSLERLGMVVTRYDRRLGDVDFDDIGSEALARLLRVTVFHASPCCSTFSQLASDKHGRTVENAHMGRSVEAKRANGRLLKLFEAVRARVLAPGTSPLVFTIENPAASFHHHPIVQRMLLPVAEGGLCARLVFVSFCAFGESVRKNTVFVTNSPTLIALAANDELLCSCSKRCAFRRKVHSSVTKRLQKTKSGELKSVGFDTADVTAFPAALTDFLANCTFTDACVACQSFRACDTTGCKFAAGHRGLCSHMAGLSHPSNRRR